MLFRKILLIVFVWQFSALAFAAQHDFKHDSKQKSAHQTNILLTNAWVRATAAGQSVGAAYLTLKSNQAVTLIAVQVNIAETVEIHSMNINNGVMKMRRLETLHLPKGKIVSLAPGGFHFMLFDLKKPLKVGENASFKLTFKAENGKEFTQNINMPILSSPAEKHDHEHAHTH